ncbi:hypothetical protein AB4256_09855 [Vibrio breoganii]
MYYKTIYKLNRLIYKFLKTYSFVPIRYEKKYFVSFLGYSLRRMSLTDNFTSYEKCLLVSLYCMIDLKLSRPVKLDLDEINRCLIILKRYKEKNGIELLKYKLLHKEVNLVYDNSLVVEDFQSISMLVFDQNLAFVYRDILQEYLDNNLIANPSFIARIQLDTAFRLDQCHTMPDNGIRTDQYIASLEASRLFSGVSSVSLLSAWKFFDEIGDDLFKNKYFLKRLLKISRNRNQGSEYLDEVLSSRLKSTDYENEIQSVRVLAMLLLAEVYMYMEKYSDAESICKDVLKEYNYCSDAYFILFQIYYINSRLDDLKLLALRGVEIFRASDKYNHLFQFWSFVKKLYCFYNKKSLREFFNDADIDRLSKISQKQNEFYIFELYFGNAYGWGDGLTERPVRFKELVQVVTSDDCRARKAYYFSIKNICHQFMLSSVFSSLDKDSIVICDKRFLELFKSNFPSLTFFPLERPKLDVALNQVNYVLSQDMYSRFKSMTPLSLSCLDTPQEKWLYGNNSKTVLDKVNGKIYVGISVGSSVQDKYRSMFNLTHCEVLQVTNAEFLDDVVLVNLDYNYSSDELVSSKFVDSNIDLKDDMLGLANLMEALDFVIVIPNNLMDAAAATGTHALVFDAFNRGSYFQHKQVTDDATINEYFLSRRVKTISGKNRREALETLAREVKVLYSQIRNSL